MSGQVQLPARLRRYGAPPDAIVLFGRVATPNNVRYLDLVEPARGDVRADAVVEFQGAPLLYVTTFTEDAVVAPLRRALALRGDGSFLGIVEPGRITVHSLGVKFAKQHVARIEENDPAAAFLIPQLALNPPSPHQREIVQNLLFRLLENATDQISDAGITPPDALSLAGRALFMRFLVDRNVVKGDEIARVCPSAKTFGECFQTAENIATTSRWLDVTFNGDLLPLSFAKDSRNDERWFTKQSSAACAKIFHTLSTIMNRTEPTGQGILEWGDIDFAHVPIGLLSQVYERHCHKHDDSAARSTSVHYTPRGIAEYMVEEAFTALENAHRARVLDPAAGAGVFLVTAFRKIVEERWLHDGKRPTRKTIRAILNNQLAGFEINEDALRLAALSLYLTALELDPHPRPLEDLQFDPLQEKVLFNVGGKADDSGLGSLGNAVGEEHRGRYDLVIGNPPWTVKKRDRKDRAAVLKTLAPIVASRLGTQRATIFSIPDDDPDLAFLWRAMEWAKASGHIAFAMHARLLFKQTDVGRVARSEIFHALTMTGVMNGTLLQKTKVWDINAQFCLLFARNEPSNGSTDGFYYVCPQKEDAVNKRGRLRIDPRAAHVITVSDLDEQPTIFKTLLRGTSLDQAVLTKIQDTAATTLGDYWSSNGLSHGAGFQDGGEAGTQKDASSLHHLRELRRDDVTQFRIDTSKLPQVASPTLLRTRDVAIYKEPLIVISRAPGTDRSDPRAAISFAPIAYHETFIGFSCAGHREAKDLVRYLLLLFNSSLPFYLALLTSSQFGVERRTFMTVDLDRMPFVPLEKLSASLREMMVELSDSLLDKNLGDYGRIDSWAAQVYGLNRWDREVIGDTLAIAAPFKYSLEHAQSPPRQRDIDKFLSRLREQLQPFVGPQIDLRASLKTGEGPWIWFDLTSGSDAPPNDYQAIVAVADDVGATQIVAPAADRITIGMLGQMRYWTATRARLLALDILERSELLGMLAPGHVA